MLERFRDARTELWGYRFLDKRVAIKPQFAGAAIFQGDRAAVRLTNGWAFIGRTGAIIERIAEDTATATAIPIPRPEPPLDDCHRLRCYMELLGKSDRLVGGEIAQRPERGEGSSSAGLWKHASGAVVIDIQGYEGGITTLLLPGVTPDSAERWAAAMRPYLPPSTPGGGCQFELTAGRIRGGSSLQYRHGC